MKIFARAALVDPTELFGDSALLLEGAWPESWRAPERESLDETLDGAHAWIDLEATQLAEMAIERFASSAARQLHANPAFVHAVKLRYFFIKLLRVVAWFDENPRVPAQAIIYLTRGRDEPYAALLDALAHRHGIRLAVQWSGSHAAPLARHKASRLRRCLAAARRRANTDSSQWTAAHVRAVFSGQPRLLEPVAEALHERGVGLAWLYPELAIRSWLRWRHRGVRQFTCDRPEASLPPPGEAHVTGLLSYRGVELGEAVRIWLGSIHRAQGADVARWAERLEEHFGRSRPTHLIVDEDQTPFHRLAVAAARRHSAQTLVVQHGAPMLALGFAPLLADRVLAWGETSREQFMHWGIDDDRIAVVGAPMLDDRIHAAQHKPWRAHKSNEHHGPTLLLLATPAPRDERPDSLAYHFTTGAWRMMLRETATAVARIPGVRLWVRPHPRDASQRWLDALRAAAPKLDVRRAPRGDLHALFTQVDGVLSCASSAGIEATLAGVSVVQLMPTGSRDLIDARDWGLAGTARTADELESLLRIALAQGAPPPSPRVMANLIEPAAERIADLIVGARRLEDVIQPRGPHFLRTSSRRERSPWPSA